MLVVRELSLGPKRFRDLLANLPGIGTNLLTVRLKALTEAGVIRRATLPPPAGVGVYELTPRGEALVPTLEGLALWGFGLLDEPDEDVALRAAWAALSMRAVMNAGESRGVPDGRFAFDVAGERFHVTIADGHATVRDGVSDAPADVTVSTDVATFAALASHRSTAVRAARDGSAVVDGDPRRLDGLLAAFHLPEPVG